MYYYFNCKHCGKACKQQKYPNVYCSMTCKKEASQAKAITTCPTCTKEFEYYKSWPRKYCSKLCAGRSYSKDRTDKIAIGCAQCAKPLQRVASRVSAHQQFCSRACRAQYQGAHSKGKPNIKNRKPRPQLHKRVLQTCKKCGKVTEVKESHAAKGAGRYCSRDCARVSRTGSNNHFWRGGNEKHKDYGPNWQSQRNHARSRDRYTCLRCGISESVVGHQLSVHHIRPFRLFGIDRYKEANTISNLACYCPTCHNIIEHATTREYGSPREQPIHTQDDNGTRSG